jgi:tRNA nucleotidyltransferase/poly(A) polymerase
VSTGTPATPATVRGEVLDFLRGAAPWLCEQSLGTCVVGSHALALACAASGTTGPRPADIDLAWALDLAAGERLLREHAVFLPTTDGNVGRGTLAMKLGGQRVEITMFRGSDASVPLTDRILRDLAARDMTSAALACELATGRLHDPSGGLRDWQARKVQAVGDPADRVREHPIRWVRYFRKAHEWDFELDRRIRALDLPHRLLDTLPKEAIAGELRAILLRCRSSGRCLLELHEARLLDHLAPDLARQFDGRPAGPQRWHPEVGQALHLILALEWAHSRCRHLDERDRLAVMIAVLCHDFGKSHTQPDLLPGHPGHDRAGARYVERFLDRWPGLADPRARMLAVHVCELHIEIRDCEHLRAGTLARLYDRYFRARDYPVDLFALAVGADSGGRLGLEHDGDRVRERVTRDVEALRRACASVDAGALRAEHQDLAGFQAALHQARARAVSASQPWQ